MEIPKILFICALIFGFMYLVGAVTRAKAEKCLQFGDNVFEGPDGNCYSCPDGFTTKTDKTEIALNSLGIPICVKNATKPMNLLRRTVSPANVIAGGYARAEMVGTNVTKAELKGSFTTLTSCPVGSTPNESSGMCYACPDGYTRTSADVNSVGACKKPCSEGSFEGNYDDVGSFGKCYKCPSGYSRTKEPLDSDKACFVNCPHDSFTLKDQCYKCPDGYTKNANAISPDEACYKPCSADGSNIFEYRETQSCYECPVGYTKDPSQNVSPFNSLSCINHQQKPANLISIVGEDGRMVPPDVIQEKLKTVKGVLVQ